MATFSGGETIVNVLSVSGSSIGTIYTVPAGRYAKIHVNKLDMADTGDRIDFAGQSAFGPLRIGFVQVPSGMETAVQEMILTAGQSISIASVVGNVPYQFAIREFNNP